MENKEKIPGEVYNDLRAQFQKGDAMNYLKELCEKYKEDIEEFTCTAMMAAYQKNRVKALDYMLGLPGRHPADLLVKIQTQRMMFEDEGFAKGGKMLSLICKHFPRIQNLEELDFCLKSRVNNQKVNERHKELSFMVYSQTVEEKNIKIKPNKI